MTASHPAQSPSERSANVLGLGMREGFVFEENVHGCQTHRVEFCQATYSRGPAAHWEEAPRRPRLPVDTSWTAEAFRPAELHQVRPALVLCREPPRELGWVPRLTPSTE